ncbi:MAG: DUF4126 domain-containing protein [Siphonobacter aquaeclarae]|nr:DUF4126 domain-containing protein [Siphonobacter aquaeclarae]
MEYILPFCLGLALAACSGFRVFIPLLTANIAFLTGYLTPSAGMEWLGGWTAFAILASATLAEVVGYYFPYVDHLLDSVATPASVVAGTLLMTSVLPSSEPALKWALGLIVGGGSAGLVQAGTALLRLGSTATTGGLGNPVVASAENGLATVFSIVGLFFPVFIAVIVLAMLYFIAVRLSRLRKRNNTGKSIG